jgi:hypothetical protein
MSFIIVDFKLLKVRIIRINLKFKNIIKFNKIQVNNNNNI